MPGSSDGPIAPCLTRSLDQGRCDVQVAPARTRQHLSRGSSHLLFAPSSGMYQLLGRHDRLPLKWKVRLVFVGRKALPRFDEVEGTTKVAKEGRCNQHWV